MAKPRRSDAPYFSVRLRNRLRDARAMRAIFIEAPSGYGKTTVVEEFLFKALPEETIRVGHRCMEESPRAAWRSLCRTLHKIDAQAGTALLRLGLPDEDSLGDAGRLLWGMECADPTLLVLDDFHHLAKLTPTSVWEALLEHECPHLCVALVTQPLAESVMPYEKSGFLRLDVGDLRLTEQESREYFAKAGIALNEAETEELHSRAGGWIFPLVLHLRHYRDKKSFIPASGLDGLIREVIWNKLGEPGRDFLLRLSPFDSFSSAQASRLLHLPEPSVSSIIAGLERTAHVRFDAAAGLYYPHSALLEFTRAAFARLPETARREILQAAGDWCATNGERKTAISLYYRLRDFEKILALDLSGLPDNRLLDMPDSAYADALRDIVAHCDRDMKVRHPLSMLQLVFEFFGQGCYEEYGALCAEMAALVETDAPEGERDYLRGELVLLEAFSRYNNIAEMGERMKRASQLTGAKTALTRLDNSSTFGNASVLFMYHREAGRLDAELADMERYTPHYTAMSKGHFSGGPALMRAEALLCRGKTERAEIFGHRARNDAALHSQISISMGAELFFGRLAILRGDGAALSRALDAITGLAEEYPQKSNRMEADMARSYLAGLLHRPQDASEWLRYGPPDTFSRRLFIQAIPFANLCRSHLLLLDNKPEVLLGESAALLGLASALNYAPALIYGYIHTAAAWSMRGENGEAVASLRKALDLALPDALYLPFAENRTLIKEPLNALLPGMAHECTASILALAEQMEAGRLELADALYAKHERFGLTRREHEILLLMAEGFTYDAIARQLRISPNTVKARLKAAYRKTGTTSRPLLKKMLQS